MPRLLKSIVAGLIGGAIGLVIGFVLGCCMGFAFVDFRILVPSNHPGLPYAKWTLHIGTYLGPVIGAVFAVRHINSREPPKNSS